MPFISRCFQMSVLLYVPAHLWPRKELMVPIGKETAWAAEPVWSFLQIEPRSPSLTFLSLTVRRTENSDLSIKEVCGVVLTLLSELFYLIQNCPHQIALSLLNRRVALCRITTCLYISTFTLHQYKLGWRSFRFYAVRLSIDRESSRVFMYSLYKILMWPVAYKETG